LVALTALPVATAVAAEQKQTETVDRTIPISRSGHLKLNNFSGDVRIVGTSGSEVVLHAVRRAKQEQLDNIKLDINVSGDRIEIEANRRSSGWEDRDNNVVETEFELQVPAGTSLDVHAFSGNLNVKEMSGPIEAKTFSGNIHLDVARGAQLPNITAETFSGNIEAFLPESSNGRLRFNSFSGDIRSDIPMMLRSSSRRDMSVDLGSGQGADLRFKTFSGDLKLGR